MVSISFLGWISLLISVSSTTTSPTIGGMTSGLSFRGPSLVSVGRYLFFGVFVGTVAVRLFLISTELSIS